AVCDQLRRHIHLSKSTHLDTWFDADHLETLFKKSSHMSTDAASDVQALRSRRQLRNAVRPGAIDQLPAIAEWRIEDAFATVLGEEFRGRFVVDLNGSPARPIRIGTHAVHRFILTNVEMAIDVCSSLPSKFRHGFVLHAQFTGQSLVVIDNV